MEAVGRLAGGIAHDFNNLLTVIRGQADFLLMDLPESGALAEEVRLIRDAADRAARLTHQLLAFSREQVLRPRVVDVNRILEEMDQLLRRVLGEDVSVETDLHGDPLPIRVDPSQLEQVILNLAVNARDAMPRGGRLHIATGVEEVDAATATGLPGLEPGAAVRLSVSDTGVGMDEDTRAHIFEPFYTTKSEQGGTGLGLSMSYGIVKQSGGTIHVDSAPGEGTTFVIRFPPAEGAPRRTDGRPPPPNREKRISGRIVVVEDDDSVARVARRILEREGFQVWTADTAEGGLDILAEVDADLLLTDLVLPGLSGRELVDRAGARFSDLAVVVMSGYAEGSPGSRQDLPQEVGFIQKPFTPEGLVEVVRRYLGHR
jgi:CheY-like chemotaxis protein